MTRPNITTHSAPARISRPSALKYLANRVNNVRKITYLLEMDAIILEDWSIYNHRGTYLCRVKHNSNAVQMQTDSPIKQIDIQCVSLVTYYFNYSYFIFNA